jgi:hypothetical protein
MNWFIIIICFLFIAFISYSLGYFQGCLDCYTESMKLLESIERKIKESQTKTEVAHEL